MQLRRTPVLDGTETILVVDGDRFVRDLLRRILSLHGYQVLTAADEREAQAVAERAGSLDLLVSDLLLAHGSGPELARRLAEPRPGLRSLFVSGFYRALTPRSLVPDQLLLTKPFSPDELLCRVRHLLDGVSAAA